MGRISVEKKGLTNKASCAIIPKHSRSALQYRGVEQLEARRAHNPEVVGSSPASATRLSSHSGFAMTTFCFNPLSPLIP